MQQTSNIIATEKGSTIGNFIRGIETKSVLELAPGDHSIIGEIPTSLDDSSNQINFFFNYAKFIKTGSSLVHMVIPDGKKPVWGEPITAIDLKNGDFGDSPIIISTDMKNLYYKTYVTDSMKKDIKIDLEKNFIKSVEDDMKKQLLDAFLYGDGQKQPKGILNEENEIKKIKLTLKRTELNKLILSLIENYTEIQKLNESQKFIWIMNPDFYQIYLQALATSESDLKTIGDSKKLLNYSIFVCPNLKEEDSCVLIDLSHYIIFYDDIKIEKRKGEFFTEILDFRLKIGSFCHNLKKNALVINLKVEN